MVDPTDPRDPIRKRIDKGDFLGWFEDVYAKSQADGRIPPWTIEAPHPHLQKWAERENLQGAGKTAMVIGCGWGDDAEYLATLGFKVTAFDISETAIETCQQRFPESSVTYTVADLFALPDNWLGSFDFVLENRTVQALPPHMTEAAIHAEVDLIAPNGQILVLCWGRDENTERTGVPWPLAKSDLQTFIDAGLSETSFEELKTNNGRRFRVVYEKIDH